MMHNGTLLPFTLEQTDSIFGLLFICFLVFAHLYNGGISFFKENARLLLFSNSHREHKQTTIKEIFYNYFLIFQAVVLISISLYVTLMRYEPITMKINPQYGSLLIIVAFILVLFVFIFIKYLLYSFISYLFDLREVVTVWKNNFLMLFEILGILYFIPTIILVYSQFFPLLFIVIMLLLFLAVQIIFYFRIAIFFIKEKFNCLSLILYLCTVEILPYIFLFMGLYYLYKIDILNLI